MNKLICLSISLLLGFALSVSVITIHQETNALRINTGGDWGCKADAIANIKLVAKQPTTTLIGLGDYSYGCSLDKIRGEWEQVKSKFGVPGNHECKKGQNPDWAAQVFGYRDCKIKSLSAKGGNIAVIGINQYTDWKEGSDQYKRVVKNTERFGSNATFQWILYAYHEPSHGLNCSSSHCHENAEAFASVYDPVIKSTGKGMILEAHTHLTGFGSPNGIPTAQCGTSGEGGAKVKATNEFAYASATPGYCSIDFQKDYATAQHIGTKGQVLKTHVFNK